MSNISDSTRHPQGAEDDDAQPRRAERMGSISSGELRNRKNRASSTSMVSQLSHDEPLPHDETFAHDIERGPDDVCSPPRQDMSYSDEQDVEPKSPVDMDFGHAQSVIDATGPSINPMEPRFTVPKGRQEDPMNPSEFALRYLPVVGTPESFSGQYLLRAMERKRQIKSFSVVTMYNEGPDELERTLKGICRNLDTFASKLGPKSWREFMICIVSDGRRECNPETLGYLSEIGLFNRRHMDDALEVSNDITMHLFETTLVLADSLTTEHKPLQLMFALKESNGGKLDSHRWFFNAFCAQLRPKYTFMVDVGTKPDPKAMFKLFAAMEEDPHIGGVCGEIRTLASVHANPWVAAQLFEYKVSTILDKSMESTFGFISVLPGAFSAYRYAAIEGYPLSKYFKQIDTHPKDLGPFQGNMYLAEDRILCFEVLARRGEAWTLRYVKNATAGTDVPEKLTSLIKQRRRWLNGSLFATIYVIANFGKFWKYSSHSLARKMFVSVLFAFYAGSLVLTWFLMANFYLMFSFAKSEAATSPIFDVMTYLFLFLTIIQIVTGMGNKPHQMELVYFLCCIGYGVFFFFTLGLTAQYLIDDPGTEPVLAAVGTIGAYVFSALLHGEIFPVLFSMVQYFFMLPTFLISFPIYSFCNIHDISWGTKGLENANAHVASAKNRRERESAEVNLAKKQKEMAQTEARFRTFRSYLVIAWVASNGLLIYFVLKYKDKAGGYLDATFIVFFTFNVFRFIFSAWFVLSSAFHRLLRCICCCCFRHKAKSYYMEKERAVQAKQKESLGN